MAGSRWAYVRNFELPDTLLPNTFILLRLDGHSFHRFADDHAFVKPNDLRALELMDPRSLGSDARVPRCGSLHMGSPTSTASCFESLRSCIIDDNRKSHLCLCSLFTSTYVMLWPQCFPDTPLRYAPSFDARIVLYPGAQEVRDYFSWRQADTHVNNLYNTAFWALVQQGGQTTKEAHETLRGTVSSQKHEILFSRFGINYNDLPRQFRKGSTIVKDKLPIVKTDDDEGEADIKIKADSVPNENDIDEAGVPAREKASSEKRRARAATQQRLLHCDIIADGFWKLRPVSVRRMRSLACVL
ncbi:Thg1 C terminal domain-containing protein [Lactarius akahatsu]|uniref:tRNA(His) guanylyltransferase n=1 Tax=Lactarius akahatsu TaxID=416441 RepID=A0AAD4Q4F6_9AGAM|nr:Thg1 C terminal domain-containing protein [Lactarius akahatsu]